MNRINNSFKSEKGSIIVLAVFMLILATGVFSYVVDLGRIQLARHKLYVAADMASLAGATQLDKDEARGREPKAVIMEDQAINLAEEYINRNQFDKGTEGWLGIKESQDNKISMSDYTIENAQGPNGLVAMITIETQATIYPLVFKGVFQKSTPKARSKSVVYLTY